MTAPPWVWEVFVLEYARAHAQPLASLVYGAHGGPAVDVPYAFAAARSPHGVVLIDTGFMADDAAGRALAERYAVATWVSPLRQLAAIGIGPGDVADIVVTHAHFDHMGALGQFPNARIHLQRRELFGAIEALALPPRFGFLAGGIHPPDLHAVLDAAAEHRLHLIDGDRDGVVPGVHARLAAESHTWGSQWVVLDTAQGEVAVAGDCIYCRDNLAQFRGDRQYRPLGFATGGASAQIEAMDRICAAIAGDPKRLVILHDLARWPEAELVAESEGLRVCRVGG